MLAFTVVMSPLSGTIGGLPKANQRLPMRASVHRPFTVITQWISG